MLVFCVSLPGRPSLGFLLPLSLSWTPKALGHPLTGAFCEAETPPAGRGCAAGLSCRRLPGKPSLPLHALAPKSLQVIGSRTPKDCFGISAFHTNVSIH